MDILADEYDFEKKKRKKKPQQQTYKIKQKKDRLHFVYNHNKLCG
jgi:hypothetical protein